MMTYYDKQGNPHALTFDQYWQALRDRQDAIRTNAGRRMAGRTDFLDVPAKPPEICALIAYGENGDYIGRIDYPEDAPEGASLKYEPALM